MYRTWFIILIQNIWRLAKGSAEPNRNRNDRPPARVELDACLDVWKDNHITALSASKLNGLWSSLSVEELELIYQALYHLTDLTWLVMNGCYTKEQCSRESVVRKVVGKLSLLSTSRCAECWHDTKTMTLAHSLT